MSIKYYLKSGISGETTNDLNGIDGNVVNNGDIGIVNQLIDLKSYLYVLDTDSGREDSPPEIIAPINNPGHKRWILIGNGENYSPTDLNLLGSYSGTSNHIDNPKACIIENEIAYIINYDSSTLVILDVSNPENISLIAVSDVSWGMTSPYDMIKYGNHLYITASAIDTLFVIDVYDPAFPFVVTSKDLDPDGVNGPAGMIIKNHYLFVCGSDSNNITAIDISDPSNPIVIDQVSDQIYYPLYLVCKDDYLFVSSASNNMIVSIDISDPYSMSVTDYIGGLSNYILAPIHLTFAGNYLFVCSTGFNAIVIFDISNPENMALFGIIRGTENYLENPFDIAIMDKYALVASYDASLIMIIDISNPARPFYVTSFSITNPYDLFVYGNKIGCLNATDVFSIIQLNNFDFSCASIDALEIQNSQTKNVCAQEAIINNLTSRKIIVNGHIMAYDNYQGGLRLSIDRPVQGVGMIWGAEGTGKGDAGDVLIASNVNTTTKWGTLFDYSAGTPW